MIYEVDEALRELVRRDALPGSDVEVVFDAPTKDWASRRNTPTVDVYLYDIREDLRRRERGMINDYDSGGPGGRAGTCRRATSSCPTWSPRGRSARRTSTGCCRRSCPASCGTTRSPPTCWPARSPSSRCRSPITIGLPPPEDRGFADVWSALGGELKPSLDVVIATPVDTGQRRPAGPPVTRPVTVARRAGRAGWPAMETRPGQAAPRPRTDQVTGIGLDYLSGRVGLVEGRVRALVAHRRRDDPNPDDPFRGLYLSDEARRPPAASRPRRRRRCPSAERDRDRTGRRRRRAGRRSRSGCGSWPGPRTSPTWTSSSW